jgi:hypothetical protein
MRSTRRWTEADLAEIGRGLKRLPSAPLTPSAGAKLIAAAERGKLEALLLHHLTLLGLAGAFEREARFHHTRKWRLDLYAAEGRLGVEIHGGTYDGGRHVRGRGFHDDRQKMNAAIEMGIAVLEFDAQMVRSGEAAAQVERVIRARVSRAGDLLQRY